LVVSWWLSKLLFWLHGGLLGRSQLRTSNNSSDHGHDHGGTYDHDDNTGNHHDTLTLPSSSSSGVF
jgi:hypothetical protein